ncbi:DUF4232 domain-containing protein [Streptomyces sp. NPDC058579]|uniref:DUF4232 domain-containing protein n=1 Tax=Streptomyces sp. NPDC058579 TaxID=3346548 RepID=UPI00364A1E9D
MSGRITRTRLLAATTVAIAALSLTACGDTDASSARSHGAADSASDSTPTSTVTSTPTASPSASQPATQPPSTSPTAQPAKTTAKKSGTKESGGKGDAQASTGGGGESRNPQCGAGTTKTIATPVSRPLNHLLITVTNTGKKYCDLLGYPVARFGEAQSVPPVDESTHPQAVVTLAPGESAYAGVRLSAADGGGLHGYTAKSLTVGFKNGTFAKPSLPGKGVYVDSTLQVTYWQQQMGDALN